MVYVLNRALTTRKRASCCHNLIVLLPRQPMPSSFAACSTVLFQKTRWVASAPIKFRVCQRHLAIWAPLLFRVEFPRAAHSCPHTNLDVYEPELFNFFIENKSFVLRHLRFFRRERHNAFAVTPYEITSSACKQRISSYTLES